ncbi:autotransporter strand-loop-strand O-heptosyltransferase [Acidisphaera sp. L21]|uniref:autotransporter strand-loop-strand O-heptosyltransferase n=1 Tax=Acidisphaera sp. L21 TaxID=1641851 RepID=UPI00157534C3|nr:autotransporter strand-loop-strand O-heptosyltransferase [Acidisphaera sp. L21]
MPTTDAPLLDTPKDKPAYPPAASIPTQHGPHGIRYDFNLGCRVVLPAREVAKPWRVRLRDLDTGNILFETTVQQGMIHSSKRWFVRFRIEIWAGEDAVLQHDYDARDRPVLVQFPIGTLGDTMGWFPYAVRFQQTHGCRLTCAMSQLIIPLFRDAYPDIDFVTHEALDVDRFYATYSMGLFFEDADSVWQPTDFRLVGLHRTAAYILGVDPAEWPPAIALPDDTRPIAEPYVCIGVQSSSQCKYWNNPNGWSAVITRLKERGYRVICIDQKSVHGSGLVWTHIPHGAENQTGDRPLTERARWLRHAAGFIGLSSGLSWLAWAAGTKVLMISGFTHPINEFHTPYRIHNWHACNSCWNDPKFQFDHKDFLWCPRHAGTPRQFECTRLITTEHVLATLDRMLAAE